MQNITTSRITPDLFRTKKAARAWAAVLTAVEQLEQALSNDRAAAVDAIRLSLTTRFATALGRLDVAEELTARFEYALEQAHRASAEAQERRHARKAARVAANGAKALKKGVNGKAGVALA